MDFLASQPPLQLGVIALGLVLFFVTALGFALKGPLRWVKISTLLLLVDFLALRGLYAGWESALTTAAVLVTTLFGTISFAFYQWRHPITKVLSPASSGDCPRHARAALERWTWELAEQGFEIAAEHRTVWQIQGDDRVTFVRFLAHPSEPFWFEIHALGNPKIAARMLMSDKGDGRAVMTCDQQADQELFDDPLTTIQRVERSASCATMIDAHRKLAMTTEGSLSRVEDAARAHVELYGGWVERLLATNQVRKIDATWIGLQPRSIPGLVLKTWAAWLH